MKRLFDFFTSLIALILLLPLLLVVAITIKLESDGPVFFRQPRVGQNGRIFSICKFRSMSVSSDSEGPYNTQQNDLRVTRVGKFIRATSIDELPQLINVLKGEMSIVGPRPDLERMASDYDPADWQLRNSVKPGITGLSQVNGRSNISYADRLRFDLEYARSHDFITDLKIILKTVKIVLRGSNAN